VATLRIWIGEEASAQKAQILGSSIRRRRRGVDVGVVQAGSCCSVRSVVERAAHGTAIPKR